MKAKVAPMVTTRKGLVISGSALSLPAMAASLVQASPAHADPGGSSSSSSSSSSRTTSATTTTSSSSVVYLKLGSSGSYVKIAQQRLGGLTVDGVFGKLTQAKVKKFQTSKGLSADGIIGPLTWAKLGGFPGSTSSSGGSGGSTSSCSVTTLRYGSSGSLVKTAQSRLGGLTVDGQFGSATLARVKAYQSSKGLTVTGTINSATWSKLGGYPCGTSTSGGTSSGGTSSSTVNGSQIVSIAKKYLGISYVWGGSTPSSGFDCSGLTSYVYKQAGLYIPRTARAQQAYMKKTSSPQVGDLVFFGSPAYHVGIYLGNNQMLAAPKPGDVVKIQTIYNTPSGYGTLR